MDLKDAVIRSAPRNMWENIEDEVNKVGLCSLLGG